MRQKYGVMLWIVLFTVILTACGAATPEASPQPTDIPVIVPTDTPLLATPPTIQPALQPVSQQPPIQVRFIHAAADLPVVNIYAGRAAVVTNFGYGLYTEPTNVPGGDITLRVLLSGSGSDTPPLLEIPLSSTGAEAFTVVLTNNAGAFSYFTLPDTVPPVNQDESAVQVIHAADAPEITISSGANQTSVQPGTESAALVLPAGDTTLTFAIGGVSQLSYPITLREQQSYTLVATGSSDALSVIVYSAAAPGRTSARVVNTSTVHNAVDLYLENTLLASNVETYRASSRTDTISGLHRVAAYPAGADPTTTEPLVQDSLYLESGAATIFLLGSGADSRLLAASDDISPTPVDKARITFVNTLPDMWALRSETIPLTSGVNYGETPVTTLVTAGTFTFFWSGVQADGTTVAAELVENALLEAGRNYLYLITGRTDSQAVILSEPVGVDTALVEQGDPTDILNPPAQIRFINATTEALTTDFLINGQPAVTNVAFGQGSSLISINQPGITATVRQSGADSDLIQQDISLQSDQRLTVILTGSTQSGMSFMIVPDDTLIFDGQSPHVRLINLSGAPDTRLGLGYLSFGTIHPIAEVDGQVVSLPVLLPVSTIDLSLLDPAKGTVLTTITETHLEAGEHYDMITFYDPETAISFAFVVVYPASD